MRTFFTLFFVLLIGLSGMTQAATFTDTFGDFVSNHANGWGQTFTPAKATIDPADAVIPQTVYLANWQYGVSSSGSGITPGEIYLAVFAETDPYAMNESNLLGVSTNGVDMLAAYNEWVAGGGVEPSARCSWDFEYIPLDKDSQYGLMFAQYIEGTLTIRISSAVELEVGNPYTYGGFIRVDNVANDWDPDFEATYFADVRDFFYDDFSYGTTQGALDYGWIEIEAGDGWGVDSGVLWGHGMVLRYVTDTVAEEGTIVTIEVDRIRNWINYVYEGDLIAWDGTSASVLGSFSFNTEENPVSYTFPPVSAAYTGQKLGINYSHAYGNWGETNSIKLTGTFPPSGAPVAREPDPSNGAVEVPVTADLSWSQPVGWEIASYDVYLDPNENFLNAAEAEYYSPAQTELSFNPTPDMDYGTTYYWRVDTREPNDAVHTGFVWSFTTLSPDPKIITEPANQLLFEGETAEFTVVAMNPFTLDDTGMSYAWYRVGTPDTPIGTNSPLLTIENVTQAVKGQYYCIVTVDDPPVGVTSSPVQTINAKLLIKRLLGNWQFEGNLLDSSGNGYDGTIVGTKLTYGAIPEDDPSLQVSGDALECKVGSSNFAQMPAAVFDDVDTQITFSLWTWGVDQPNEGNQCTWIVKDQTLGTSAYMMIPHSTARIPTWIGNPDDGMDGWYEGSSAPNSWFNGKWNHWVVTKDSEAGIMRVYCNGLLHLESYGAFKQFIAGDTFYIGGNNDGTGAFGGYIDDFRVYNYALTAEEVAYISPRPMFPDPADGQDGVMYNPALSWTPGDGTSLFTVYCDTDPNLRGDAAIIPQFTMSGLTEPTTILPLNLQLETVYYWYVQEYDGVSPDPVWTSDLWDFRVRELAADIDENSAVLLEDLVAMSGGWTSDNRGEPYDILIDTGVYDPNDGYDPEDPSNYAYYWQTPWTYSGGQPGSTTGPYDKLYGTGYCEPVTEPNESIAWHYDTPSSTGGTDTAMWYYHGERPRLMLSEFKELRLEVKAEPGSVLKDNPYSWIGSYNGNWVGYTFGGISTLLADYEWHDFVWPLKEISGIENLDTFMEVDIGYWGTNVTGTYYMRNLRLIPDAEEGEVICLPLYYITEDLNFDCLVNMDDFVIMAEEWMLDARNF